METSRDTSHRRIWTSAMSNLSNMSALRPLEPKTRFWRRVFGENGRSTRCFGGVFVMFFEVMRKFFLKDVKGTLKVYVCVVCTCLLETTFLRWNSWRNMIAWHWCTLLRFCFDTWVFSWLFFPSSSIACIVASSCPNEQGQIEEQAQAQVTAGCPVHSYFFCLN